MKSRASVERTFLQDTDDRKVLRACLRAQAADISARLKHRRLGAHTVQVKVRYGDFTTLTRQITVEDPLTEASDIYRLGCFLLGRENLVFRPLRLLGLGVAGLREPNVRGGGRRRIRTFVGVSQQIYSLPSLAT
jgi:DNA polymerase IV